VQVKVVSILILLLLLLVVVIARGGSAGLCVATCAGLLCDAYSVCPC